MKKIRSILIVDDSQSDVYLSEYYLEEADAADHIWSYHNPVAALELFKDPEKALAKHPDEFPPSLVLLDINMPLLNGFEFLEALEALDHQHPVPAVVVMLTTSDLTEDAERAKKSSLCKKFLNKPLESTEVQALVEEYGEELVS